MNYLDTCPSTASRINKVGSKRLNQEWGPHQRKSFRKSHFPVKGLLRCLPFPRPRFHGVCFARLSPAPCFLRSARAAAGHRARLTHPTWKQKRRSREEGVRMDPHKVCGRRRSNEQWQRWTSPGRQQNSVKRVRIRLTNIVIKNVQINS